MSTNLHPGKLAHLLINDTTASLHLPGGSDSALSRSYAKPSQKAFTAKQHQPAAWQCRERGDPSGHTGETYFKLVESMATDVCHITIYTRCTAYTYIAMQESLPLTGKETRKASVLQNLLKQ